MAPDIVLKRSCRPAKETLGTLVFLTLAMAGCAGTGLTTTTKEISLDPLAYADKTFTVSQLPVDVVQKITTIDNGPLPWKTISMHTVRHKILVTQGTELDINSDAQYENLGGPFVLETSTISTNSFVSEYTFYLTYRGLVTVAGQIDILSNQYSNWPTHVQSIAKMESLPAALTAHRPLELTVDVLTVRDKNSTASTDSKRCAEKGAPYSASVINPDITGQAVDLSCSWRNDSNIETKTDIETYLFDFGFTVPKQLADRSTSLTYKVTSWHVD